MFGKKLFDKYSISFSLSFLLSFSLLLSLSSELFSVSLCDKYLLSINESILIFAFIFIINLLYYLS